MRAGEGTKGEERGWVTGAKRGMTAQQRNFSLKALAVAGYSKGGRTCYHKLKTRRKPKKFVEGAKRGQAWS